MTRAPGNNRSGYTLVEALIAMGSATFLLVGLATTLSISATALDSNFVDCQRSVLGEAQSLLHSDLASAKYFTERTATAVAFAAPDRDGDGEDDVLRYSWSGTPGDPLNLSYNGGTPAPALGDVQSFNLTYTTESFTPPTLTAHAGYSHAYANQQTGVQGIQCATRFTVVDPVTITGITAFVGGSPTKDFRAALYDDDGGEPNNLLTESAAVRTPATAVWTSTTVPDTLLAPGDYWLAVAVENSAQSYQYTAGSGEFRTVTHDAVTNGFLASWGTSDSTDTRRISIYAVHGTN